MGLGKTLITLDYLCELNPKGHVLIIAPLAIANITWETEIQKWKYPFRRKSLTLNEKGRPLSREDRFKIYEEMKTAKPTLYYINQEKIIELIENTSFPFSVVIIDESQAFKSPRAKRTKALMKVMNKVDRVVLLSGTPTTNSLLDIWSQIYLLDGGERLGRSNNKFINEYFFPKLYVNNRPVTYEPQFGAKKRIYDKISDITLSLSSNLIKLPEITYNNIEITLTDSERKLYKKFKKDYVLDIDGNTVTASNAAVLSSKLRQLASGAIYINDEKDYKIIHKHKLDVLERIINNTPTPVLIAYHFKSDLELIKNRLSDMKIDFAVFNNKKETFDKWNNGELKALLIQPQSHKYGLNLQDGGSTLVWYTLPWSIENYLQTNARIYRQGQKNPTVIHKIIVKNTIDDHVLLALEKKQTTLKELLAAIEHSLNS